jgi:hypothetical protein
MELQTVCNIIPVRYTMEQNEFIMVDVLFFFEWRERV